jgi:hypothetical protein
MKDSLLDLLMAHLLWQLRFGKLKWAGAESVAPRQLQCRPDQAAPRNARPRDRTLASTVFFPNPKILVDSPCFSKVMQALIVIPAIDLPP